MEAIYLCDEMGSRIERSQDGIQAVLNAKASANRPYVDGSPAGEEFILWVDAFYSGRRFHFQKKDAKEGATPFQARSA